MRRERRAIKGISGLWVAESRARARVSALFYRAIINVYRRRLRNNKGLRLRRVMAEGDAFEAV